MTARLATPADNALLTEIVTHPEVWRWVAADNAAPFDPADWTEHPTNFAVIVDGGCFTAMCLEQGAYAIHTNFLPEFRGMHALRQARDALMLAFTATPAEQLYTMVPANNDNALGVARVMGFKDTYTQHGAWTKDKVKHDIRHFRMDIDDWVLHEGQLEAKGKHLHALLDQAELLTHEDDFAHELYVGAAYAMVEAQNAVKAQRIYGRWARTAGYLPFTVTSADPLRIDIGTCTLVVGDQGDLAIEEN